MAVVPGRAVRLVSRFIVAGGLTGYILWKIHPRAVLAAGTGADWRPIGIAILLVLADRALMAYRWVVLLCTVEPASRPPLADVMRIFFVSTFVGTFLPASVGGDAVRAYSLAKLGVRTEDAVASVFMDRILGVASVVAMAVIGLTLARDIAGNRAILFALTAAAAVCVATVLLIFNQPAAAMATHLVGLLPLQTIGPAHRAGVLSGTRTRDRRGTRCVHRIRADHSAGHAAAGHVQRDRDEPGGLRLVFRARRRARRIGVRALPLIRGLGDRWQSSGRLSVRDRPGRWPRRSRG